MTITDEMVERANKPEPWLCCFCGEHMIYHTLEPTGCGYKAVCPPEALEAAPSAHESPPQ